MQSSRITYRARPLPAVLTRHLLSSPVICSPRQLPDGPARYPELPERLRHLRHLQGSPVRPGQLSGRTPRHPSVPGALPRTAVRPFRTRRRTDWTLVFTVPHHEGNTQPQNLESLPSSFFTLVGRDSGIDIKLGRD